MKISRPIVDNLELYLLAWLVIYVNEGHSYVEHCDVLGGLMNYCSLLLLLLMPAAAPVVALSRRKTLLKLSRYLLSNIRPN